MTVLGHHSAAELRDWLAAIDYQIEEVRRAYAAFASTWRAHDAGAEGAWKHDWTALLSRYSAARTKAEGAIARAHGDAFVADSLYPVEDEWQAVNHALARTPGSVVHGNFQDVYERLSAAMGRPIDLSRTPQPTALDVDLATYKAADTVIRAGEGAARSLAHAQMGPGTKLLIGGGLVLSLYLATKAVFR